MTLSDFALTANRLKGCSVVSSHSLNTPIHTEAWSTVHRDGSGVGEGERPATPTGFEHPTIPTPPTLPHRRIVGSGRDASGWFIRVRDTRPYATLCTLYSTLH